METLRIIFSMSITGSLIFFIYLLIKPLIKKNLNSSWHYRITIMILAFFILPIGKFMKIPDTVVSPILSIERETSQILNTGTKMGNILDTSKIKEDMESPKDMELIIDKDSKGPRHYRITKGTPKKNFKDDIIPYIWIMGMIILALFRMIPYIRFRSTIKGSLDIEDEYILGVFNSCMEKLRIDKNIGLKSCSYIGSPMLVGIFNPVILIPNMGREENTLNMIFLHELNHYRRKDIVIKHLSLLINIIHWFNPILYMLLKDMDLYCEFSIDEKVIGDMDMEDRKSYGETILTLIDNSIVRGGALTTNMSSGGMELKSRLENILFFKSDSRAKHMKSILVLTLILLSGFIISCGVMADIDKNTPLIAYMKDDGLYFTYLDYGKEFKIQGGTDFDYPMISKAGSYIAYTKGDNLYIFDIEAGEYERIADGVDNYYITYDWVDDENIVYATNEKGFTKLNMSTGERIEHKDEYVYRDLKSSGENGLYGKAIFQWTTEEGNFSYTSGIVEIDLDSYDKANKRFATDIIIEGKKSTDDMIGYDPTIFHITEDGRYIYVMEKFASGSLSADIGGVGVYDVERDIHMDFTDIYGVEEVDDELTVLPRKNNLAINPKNNNMIGIVRGPGRDMILDKEVVLLDIDGDKNYKVHGFMDENMVAMTPSFTVDGKKLLYSATIEIDPYNRNNGDYNEAYDDWYSQPHNIYAYDIESSKVEKITEGDNFDFMPMSMSNDTILFIRDIGGENRYFNLMKTVNGKEELIAENLIFKDQFYGHIQTETAIDILPNAKKLNLNSDKYMERERRMDSLYEMREGKIGDNSRVGNILSLLSFPDDLTWGGMELFTKEEPYGLQVNLNGDTEMQMKYESMSSNDGWKSQSMVIFSLIDNLDYIRYIIDDGDKAIVVEYIDRQQADSITMSTLGMRISEVAKNKRRFRKFYDIYGN